MTYRVLGGGNPLTSVEHLDVGRSLLNELLSHSVNCWGFKICPVLSSLYYWFLPLGFSGMNVLPAVFEPICSTVSMAAGKRVCFSGQHQHFYLYMLITLPTCLLLLHSSDLVHTTESLRSAKLSAGKNEKDSSNLDAILEPYQTENAQLTRENNELHLEILKLKEQSERHVKGKIKLMLGV